MKTSFPENRPGGIPAPAENLIPAAVAATEKKPDFGVYATSSSDKAIYEVLAAGKENIPDLPIKQKQITKSNRYEAYKPDDTPGAWRINFYGAGKNRMITSLTLVDALTITGWEAMPKMWRFITEKAFSQCYDYAKKEMYNDAVQFSLQELVDIGMYGGKDQARRGFIKAINGFKRHFVNITNDEKKIDIIGLQLVRQGLHKNGKCFVLIEKEAPWFLVFQYLTRFPHWYYSLKQPRGASLVDYLCRQARAECDNIVKNGGVFYVSSAVLQKVLNLPNIEKTKNPQRDLWENGIEAAVNAIEAMQRDNPGSKCFSFEFPGYAEAENFTDYFPTAKIKVICTPEYLEMLKPAAKQREKKIKEKEKKAERIQTNALAKVIAKEKKKKN